MKNDPTCAVASWRVPRQAGLATDGAVGLYLRCSHVHPSRAWYHWSSALWFCVAHLLCNSSSFCRLFSHLLNSNSNSSGDDDDDSDNNKRTCESVYDNNNKEAVTLLSGRAGGAAPTQGLPLFLRVPRERRLSHRRARGGEDILTNVLTLIFFFSICFSHGDRQLLTRQSWK